MICWYNVGKFGVDYGLYGIVVGLDLGMWKFEVCGFVFWGGGVGVGEVFFVFCGLVFYFGVCE